MTSRFTISVMAIGCALSVANMYYRQPLLVEMGRDFRVGDREMGIVSMLGQVGFALGLLCFVPLGDRLERPFLCGGALGSFAGSQAWSRWGWTGVCAVGSAFMLVALVAFRATARRRPHLEQGV